MPRQTPTLNDRVRLERRVIADDGYGNERGDWAVVPGCAVLRAAVTEYVIGGGETVQAAKLQGQALAECWLRVSHITKAIKPEDRLINLADDTVLNIRHVNTPERDARYLRIVVQRGVADG